MGSLFSSPAQPNPAAEEGRKLKRRRRSVTGASSDAAPLEQSPKRPRASAGNGSACLSPLSESRAKIARVRRRKRKVAVMVGYIGEKYYGMQVNVGVLTIEKVLLDALHTAGAISDENKDSVGRINWMRAARTDKGVSAASQCVSAKLECEVNGEIDPRLVEDVRRLLPDDVHLYGILRATSAFNARSDCHRRRYEYILPVRILGGANVIESGEDAEAGDPRVAKLNEILSSYVGTHCFANFTEGLSGSDDSARRYMISVTCTQPFLPAGSGVHYVSIVIFGQSFVLHQIRKMVGLALFVYLGRVPPITIPVALSPHVRLPTPTAPSLGLLLDDLYFDQYNTRHKNALSSRIGMEDFQEEKTDFKLKKIYARISERERLNRTMESWIRSSLNRQKYDLEKIEQLHKDFVLSDSGLEAQRKARIASLYPIVTNMETFAKSDGSVADLDCFKLATSMRTEFERRFGKHASFVVRAPGRVVLMGDHIDYNDMPVVAVALSQSTLIAGCVDAASKLELQHVESDAFVEASLHSDGARLAEKLEPSETNAERDEKWVGYVSGAIKTMVSDLKLSKRTEPSGGKLLVGGTLPRGFGLGSSSSLVTAAAMSAARLNRKRLPRHTVSETAARGERAGAGTQGGSLDHAVCMGAMEDSAVHVTFVPKLGTAPLRLPEEAAFVVINSNVVSEKGPDGDSNLLYNTRVAECRVASAILARRLKTVSTNMVQTAGQLLQMARKTQDLKVESLADLRERVADVMAADETMAIADVFSEMKIGAAEVKSRFLKHLTPSYLEVGKRISHVLSEAERVGKFKSLLEGDCARDTLLESLGEIMNESHLSLKDLYECSCDAVDDMVAFCNANGAAGSRITGAGWGGCVVSLIPKNKLGDFLAVARKQYGEQAVFVVNPAGGAAIFAIHASYNNPRPG